MCHNRTIKNKINRPHKRSLRLIYNDKISSLGSLLKRDKVMYKRGDHTRGGRGGSHAPPSPPLFLRSKKTNGDKGKKERVSKQKLLKGCYQGQNIIVLTILERLKFENFLLFSVPCPSHFEIRFAGPV